jgi:hypothetical protein
MQKLAKKYGLSDVGLAKTCRRLRIPFPGRGYWAKKQFGKPVRRTPLPKLPPNVSGEVQEFVVRELRRVDDAGQSTGPVADQERFEALAENAIVVADTLTDPHPLVAQTVTALRRAKPNSQGYLVPRASIVDVYVSLDGADRAMCIVDALLKALDARGFTTSIRPSQQDGNRATTVVRIGEEDVPISLSERIDVVERVDPVPPPNPRATHVRRQWGPALAPRPVSPRRELVSTGQFSLRINESYLGIRCTWSDGKQQRVDQSLNAFVVGLVVAAERLREQRLEREARERERRIREEQRLQEERRRAEEAGRVRALESVLSAWRNARDIRQYVAEARAALARPNDVAPDAPMVSWLAWCENYAARVDPFIPQPAVPKDPGPPHSSMYGWR